MKNTTKSSLIIKDIEVAEEVEELVFLRREVEGGDQDRHPSEEQDLLHSEEQDLLHSEERDLHPSEERDLFREEHHLFQEEQDLFREEQDHLHLEVSDVLQRIG